MKALILKDTKNVYITDIQTPTCGADETLLKITHRDGGFAQYIVAPTSSLIKISSVLPS